jgi:hypothetical protein
LHPVKLLWRNKPVLKSNKYLNYLLISFAFSIGMAMVFLLALRIFHLKYLLNHDYFLNWDASLYHFIALHSYSGSSSDFHFNFFPLFPFTWMALGVGTAGIIIFNALLYIFSASLLGYVFKIPVKTYLLLLTFPSLIFMFLPYTEAVFFFASVLVLTGLKKEKVILIMSGLFLCCLARPAAVVFIPVLLILLIYYREFASIRKRIIYYILACIAGLFMVILIQYNISGDWLAFFHAHKLWGGKIELPKLPLTTWGGDNIVRLDGFAFLAGLASLFYAVKLLLKKPDTLAPANAMASLFSLLFLGGICFLQLFTMGGSLPSMNRYVIATPFFFIALSAFINSHFKWKELLYIFILLNLFWLLFGSYVHIDEVLLFGALSLYIVLFLLTSHQNKYLSYSSLAIIISGNAFLQVYFFCRFLDGCWVG